MRILFTGAGRRIELIQAFRSAALELDKELVIYGADIVESAPALAFCDRSRIVVPMNDPVYIQNLLDICRKDSIDLLIPTIDTDLIVLSENKKRFEEARTKVMVSNHDMVCACRDKSKTFRLFEECGLKAPNTVSDWKEYGSGYPAFIKPRDGSSSINTFRVNSIEELKEYAARIDDYIIQPFVSGREYTVDIMCDWEGAPISIVPRERLVIRAGEVLKARIDLDVKMIDACRRLCKKLTPCGPLTVQLIRDENGEDWYIEINPRFGGGAPLSMKAGARSAEAILKLIDGERVDHVTDIADGAQYSRFDQSVCVIEGKRRIKGVIFDLDDTLYSEKDYIRSGYREVSEYLGGGYEERLWSYFEEGKPAIDELLSLIHRENARTEVVKVYREHKPDIHLFDGVNSIINELRSRGIKVGIITDGRPEGQRNKIDALKIDVDDIIITDELGGVQFRKPSDIAYRIMITRWRLNPADVVYVGDNTEKDFQAPLQLGMKCIWFKNEDSLYYDSLPKVSSIIEINDLNRIIEEIG